MKKIASFFFLILPSFIFGQIVHTDVDPDSLVSGVYELDVNNDEQPEFIIKAVNEGGINIVRAEGISVKDSLAGFYAGFPNVSGFPYALSSDEDISINRSWVDKGILGGDHSIIMEDAKWNTVQSRYLGLRFEIDSSVHYGWARLKMGTSYASFTVREYAYNATPMQPINSGVTAVEEHDNTVSEINMFPNPAGENISLSFSLMQASEIRLSIYDLNGKLISEESKGRRTKGNQLFRFDISDLKQGMYYCRIDTDTNSAMHKFIVVR